MVEERVHPDSFQDIQRYGKDQSNIQYVMEPELRIHPRVRAGQPPLETLTPPHTPALTQAAASGAVFVNHPNHSHSHLTQGPSSVYTRGTSPGDSAVPYFLQHDHPHFARGTQREVNPDRNLRSQPILVPFSESVSAFEQPSYSHEPQRTQTDPYKTNRDIIKPPQLKSHSVTGAHSLNRRRVENWGQEVNKVHDTTPRLNETFSDSQDQYHTERHAEMQGGELNENAATYQKHMYFPSQHEAQVQQRYHEVPVTHAHPPQASQMGSHERHGLHPNQYVPANVQSYPGMFNGSIDTNKEQRNPSPASNAAQYAPSHGMSSQISYGGATDVERESTSKGTFTTSNDHQSIGSIESGSEPRTKQRTANLMPALPDSKMMGPHISYHEALTGKLAEQRLRLFCKFNPHCNRCYLTRYSSKQKSYSLSVYKKEKDTDDIFHFKIVVQKNGKHSIQGKTQEFNSTGELLDFYEKNPFDPHLTTIGRVCTKQDYELAEEARDREIEEQRKAEEARRQEEEELKRQQEELERRQEEERREQDRREKEEAERKRIEEQQRQEEQARLEKERRIQERREQEEAEQRRMEEQQRQQQQEEQEGQEADAESAESESETEEENDEDGERARLQEAARRMGNHHRALPPPIPDPPQPRRRCIIL